MPLGGWMGLGHPSGLLDVGSKKGTIKTIVGQHRTWIMVNIVIILRFQSDAGCHRWVINSAVRIPSDGSRQPGGKTSHGNVAVPMKWRRSPPRTKHPERLSVECGAGCRPCP